MSGFSFKAGNEILRTWRKIKSLTRIAFTGKVDPDLIGVDAEHIKKQIADCVFGPGGETSGRTRAIELGKVYLSLSHTGREKFMRILSRGFDTDKIKLADSIAQYNDAVDEEARARAEINLAKTLVPLRTKLLKQFSSLPNGFKFLIDFRAELLPIRKNDPYLRKLDSDLKELFSSWFDIGLLDLEEITWQSPAALLEKMIEYEAVHEIQSWNDLKNRLDSDRYCFAFFHNKIPGEPLIFVEVALMDKMADNIQQILDEQATTQKPENTDTAVFYSISNAQLGLAGINLGNFLVKRVVDVLSQKLKGLKHFVTLSPLPKFRRWLDPMLYSGDEALLKGSEIKRIKTKTGHENAAKWLSEIFETNWYEDENLKEFLRPIMIRLAGFYLLNIKKGDKAFDPVANFHLSNGARIERLNWLADISEKGLQQSAGIMVNYYYKPDEIEKNHEMYFSNSQIRYAREIAG